MTNMQCASDAESYKAMLDAVQVFHDKHRLREAGGEDLPYRIALMAEELGEISACVTKGKGNDCLSEECADLLILLLGTAIAAGFDLNKAFWSKMAVLDKRGSRLIEGRVRVSDFEHEVEK